MSRDSDYTDAARKTANKCLEIALEGRQDLVKAGFAPEFVVNFIPNAASTFLATALELLYQELSGNDLPVEKTWDKVLEHKAKIGPLAQNILTERAAEDGILGVLRKTIETDPDKEEGKDV